MHETDPVQLAMPLDVTTTGRLQTHLLRFPYLPPSKNQFDGWPAQWKSSAKRKWIREIEKLTNQLDLPKGLRFCGLAARLVFPTHRKRDPQNYSQALWNWVPDGLQRSGVLLGDHDGTIEFGPNLGITMAVDLRPGISAAKRSRTVVALTVEHQ